METESLLSVRFTCKRIPRLVGDNQHVETKVGPRHHQRNSFRHREHAVSAVTIDNSGVASDELANRRRGCREFDAGDHVPSTRSDRSSSETTTTTTKTEVTRRATESIEAALCYSLSGYRTFTDEKWVR